MSGVARVALCPARSASLPVAILPNARLPVATLFSLHSGLPLGFPARRARLPTATLPEGLASFLFRPDEVLPDATASFPTSVLPDREAIRPFDSF